MTINKLIRNLKIGGDFEIDVKLFDNLAHNNQKLFSFGRKYEILTDSGLSAIQIALEQLINLNSNKIIWLPSYICPSVINLLVQLEFDIKFYAVNEFFCIDDLSIQIECNDIFFYINYFGFQNISAVRFINKINSKLKIWVIEDCVQVPFNSYSSPLSHFIITSFRKYSEIPDGALLSSDFEFSSHLEEANENDISKKIIGKILRNFSTNDELYLGLLMAAEKKFFVKNVPKKISFFSNYLLERIDIKRNIDKRRENYKYLFEKLSTISSLCFPICGPLDPLTVPLGLPVKVLNYKRNDLRNYLMKYNIFCAIHWDIEQIPLLMKFQKSRLLSQEILTLPIDQRYSLIDMERIFGVLSKFLNEQC